MMPPGTKALLTPLLIACLAAPGCSEKVSGDAPDLSETVRAAEPSHHVTGLSRTVLVADDQETADEADFTDLPRWISQLAHAEALYLRARISRYEQFPNEESGVMERRNERQQYVEVFMSPSEILLASWLKNESGTSDRGAPDYLMSFDDGSVNEYLWSADSSSYRTASYESPYPYGPRDFSLLHGDEGCMIGTFSQSWVGFSSPHLAFLADLYRRGRLRPASLAGEGIQQYVREVNASQLTRMDTFEIDDAALLRWHTVERLHDPETPYGEHETVQIREYEELRLGRGSDLRDRVEHYFSFALSGP